MPPFSNKSHKSDRAALFPLPSEARGNAAPPFGENTRRSCRFMQRCADLCARFHSKQHAP